MLTPQRVQNPEIAPQQYAVVLVNEEQLDQLMRRPAMRRINTGFAPADVYARYRRLKRWTAGVGAVLLVIAAGGLLWFVAPQPAMASMLAWTRPPAAPTLHTGASFSVTVASVGSSDGAASAAARVRALGLPAFTRRSPGKTQVHQAMVGPYASLDEAERAQRRLGDFGYRGARLFVDESLRGSPRGTGQVQTPHANPGVALLGAPDRLSLVLEFESEPRQVRSSRPSESTVEIDVGPMPEPAQPQQWSAPDGVHLLHTVAIEGMSAAGGLQYTRARVAVPEFAKANVRAEGKRVYVDLTWSVAADDVRAPRRAAPEAPRESSSAAPAPAAVPERAGDVDAYRDAMEPVHRRIREVRPFLISAAQSGSVDVLTALDRTLSDLESSLVAMKVPADESGQHQLLVSAARTARRGLEPGFQGDRLAHMQKALTMFEGAMAPAFTPLAQ